MNIQKKYQKIESELDRIVRTELNYRVSGRKKKQDISKTSEVIELKNREIVEAHKSGKTFEILPAMFSWYLQTREGGELYLYPEGLNEQTFERYVNKKGRFETLFAASLMALPEKDIIFIVDEKKRLFEDQYVKIKDVMTLTRTIENIRKEADMTRTIKPEDEETAVSYLREIAPLKADMETIESRYLDIKEADYIQEAVQKLQGAIHSASKSISEKSRNAAKFLFDQANNVFHGYKSTDVTFHNMELFTAQKQELLRYAKNFDGIGDEERKIKIDGFIAAIDKTVENLQNEINKQKEHEARLSEKVQQEINEAYDRFLDIKEMYALGELSTDSQKKNAAEKLKKYRDSLIANGQRIMARDIERFINSTGIGKKESSGEKDGEDDFDYKKGFLILLPITIVLLLLVFLMIIL